MWRRRLSPNCSFKPNATSGVGLILVLDASGTRVRTDRSAAQACRVLHDSGTISQTLSGAKSMKSWLFLVIAIISEVIATSALKSSEGFTKLVPSAVVVVGYGIAFYFLSLVMKAIPVGVAYAVWSGLGIVLIAAVAWILHGQKLDAWAFVGMGLIVSGVAVLNLLSKTSAH